MYEQGVKLAVIFFSIIPSSFGIAEIQTTFKGSIETLEVPPVLLDEPTPIYIEAQSNQTVPFAKNKYKLMLFYFCDYTDNKTQLWSETEINGNDFVSHTFLFMAEKYSPRWVFLFELHINENEHDHKMAYGQVATCEHYNIPDEKEYIAETKDNLSFIHNGVQSFCNEKFYLYNFTNIINADRYIYIDLSRLKFIYKSEFDFLLPSLEIETTLSVENEEGIFYLVNYSVGEAKFHGKFIYDNGYYSFKLTDVLYVNKYTGEMSKEQDKNTIKANHIYMPIGKFNTYNKIDMSISMHNVGLNKCTILKNATLHFNKNLFGNDATSCYTITAKPSIPDYNTGNTYTIK